MKIYNNIGEYRHYTHCRFCLKGKIQPVINLGLMPLAGGFFKKGTTRKELEKEKFYPLSLNFCKDCYLLQVNISINPDILFKNYFYFSSSIKTLVNHFRSVAAQLAKEIKNPKKSFIVEIGCNDGAFLDALKQKGFKRLGIDPATNIVMPLIKKGFPIINDYFSQKVAKKILKINDQADAVYSFHSMAHIEDMHDVIKGIKILLKDDGFLAFEVHYLGNLIDEFQYDMLYHEHQYYYSLTTLINFFARYDMDIYDAKLVPIRAGSIMFFVQNKNSGKRKTSPAVNKLLIQEKRQALDKIVTYKKFSKYIQKTKKDLLGLLTRLKAERKTIAGYGASGRGTVIMNYCGLDSRYLEYVIDDAPAKHGAYSPGTHLKITPSSALLGRMRPDYVVLFAWPFIDEIKRKNIEYLKNGGKFIIPLPKVRIVG